jgi:uncharacterized protein YxeA
MRISIQNSSYTNFVSLEAKLLSVLICNMLIRSVIILVIISIIVIVIVAIVFVQFVKHVTKRTKNLIKNRQRSFFNSSVGLHLFIEKFQYYNLAVFQKMGKCENHYYEVMYELWTTCKLF